MSGWLRTYQTPLWLTAIFLILLAVFAVTPEPDLSSAEGEPATTSEPTPGPHECVVCGIDQTCDPDSGRCMFVDATPLPCVEGARYDDKAGFCLPSGTPRIIQPTPATGGFPPGIRQPGRIRSRIRPPREGIG